MSERIIMDQAVKTMRPLLSEGNRFELIGLLSALLWLFAGLISDSLLYLVSMGVSTLIFVYAFIESLLPYSDYFFNLNSASFRRSIIAVLAHSAFTTGNNRAPEIYEFAGFEIPIIQISEFVTVGFVILWFGSRYYDQLKDVNISKTQLPYLIVRGIFRSAIIVGFLYAIFTRRTEIPDNLQIPWLLAAYALEPFIHAIFQTTNKTYSRIEMSLGTARLPIVALRESLLSNLLLLWGTMIFNGLDGEVWDLVRILYIFALVFAIVQSSSSLRRFKADPLGKDPLGRFMQNIPKTLEDLDIAEQFGHVVKEETTINLSKKSQMQVKSGSVIVPLKREKNQVNALIIGNSERVVEQGGRKLGELHDGLTTIMVPAKEIDTITKELVATKISELDISNLELPSLVEIQKMLNNLSLHIGGWVDNIARYLTKIDLSNYSITNEGDSTVVHLPGIYVNETPDMTMVNVMGVRVVESNKSSTVRIGNWLTVVDLPRASFVNLPGITVLDIDHVGSAVSVFGLKVSDGIPADKLDELKRAIFEQLNQWDAGLDANLGRMLADRRANAAFSITSGGEFKPLLQGRSRVIGDHAALQKSPADTLPQEQMAFLPGNFQPETTQPKKSKFSELTGIKSVPLLKDGTKRHKEASQQSEQVSKKIDDIKTEIHSKKKKDYDFEIYDVDYTEEE